MRPERRADQVEALRSRLGPSQLPLWRKPRRHPHEVGIRSVLHQILQPLPGPGNRAAHRAGVPVRRGRAVDLCVGVGLSNGLMTEIVRELKTLTKLLPAPLLGSLLGL